MIKGESNKKIAHRNTKEALLALIDENEVISFDILTLFFAERY